MTTKNKRPLIILAIIGTLMLIPAVAMHFSSGVTWGREDFIVAAILLCTTGIIAELILRFSKRRTIKLLLIGALLLMLFLIWAELAVGIFGSPFAGS